MPVVAKMRTRSAAPIPNQNRSFVHGGQRRHRRCFVAAWPPAGAIAITMAATNKCLAQSNKSRAGGKATKKRNRQWTAP
jgi:hypothetical protein